LKARALVCFSATGSFATAGGLTAIGAMSLSRASSKPLRAYAVIPLFFAAQQAAEGIVWLTLGDPSRAIAYHVAVNVFLAFALVVWPSWLPRTLASLERDGARRRTLKALSWWGAIVSIGASAMLALRPATARIVGHSISYDYARSHVIYMIGYVVPTVVPFFVSTVSLARTLGVMLVVSLVATIISERAAFTSVWCFFGAILSALILASVTRERRLVHGRSS
jgi:hypothetical protein